MAVYRGSEEDLEPRLRSPSVVHLPPDILESGSVAELLLQAVFPWCIACGSPGYVSQMLLRLTDILYSTTLSESIPFG